jgi:parvulin-like peptidyl-prolyl isomerase
MALMAKMRNLAPAFIITIGGIFILFMVISDSRVTDILGQRSNNVGVVNGKEITYQEFSNFVDRARENQKAQTGQDIDEEYMDQFRDQVWDAIVTQTLVEEQYEKLGIKVTDEELRNVILNNPPDFLKRNFIDSTGKFNRQMYESALYDPRNKDVLIGAEDAVREQMLQQKLESYLSANILISEAEVKRKFMDQNAKANAEYVLAELKSIPDNSVTVTDDDMKDYYDDHLDEFKVVEQRKLKYVLFSTGTSKEDSLAIRNNLKALVDKAQKDTASFKTYVDIYSELPYSKDTVQISQLVPEAVDQLVNAAPGTILDPIPTYEGYTIYKLLSRIPSTETYVRASHILIPTGQDEKGAEAEAQAVYNQLKGGADFAKTAMQKSSDFGSARRGGDLGWFGKGQMVPEFEKAAFAGKIGDIQKPVKTSYGYHIVKTTGKLNSKFVVEKIVNKIKASGSTIDRAYNSASDFAYIAKKNEFENEAKTLNYQIRETPSFTEEAQIVPGLSAGKHMVDFAFGNSVGEVSDVFKTQQGYGVAYVSEETKAGVQKFEDAKPVLKTLVIKEKKYAKALEIVKKIKQSGSLASAKQIYAQAVYDTTGMFSPAQTVPGVGRDYAFADKAFESEVNKISEPVKGLRGYYLIKVLQKTPFDATAYNMQKNAIRESLLQQKKGMLFSQWIAELKKHAKVEDNRYQFFR